MNALHIIGNTHQFNTGRHYTEAGQRIVWAVVADPITGGRFIGFHDTDRMVEGLISTTDIDTWTDRDVLNAYDDHAYRGCYQLLALLTWYDNPMEKAGHDALRAELAHSAAIIASEEAARLAVALREPEPEHTVTVTEAEWRAAEQVMDTLSGLMTDLQYAPYRVAHNSEEVIAEIKKALGAWFEAHQAADPHCTCPDAARASSTRPALSHSPS
jgi:hypothetical protein